jgi:hypothetical protein
VTKGHKYCVLGVMKDGKWIRGAVTITCCDVGDTPIGYLACGAITYCVVEDMAIGYVARKASHIVI